jgi:hypothetical protein
MRGAEDGCGIGTVRSPKIIYALCEYGIRFIVIARERRTAFLVVLPTAPISLRDIIGDWLARDRHFQQNTLEVSILTLAMTDDYPGLRLLMLLL